MFWWLFVVVILIGGLIAAVRRASQLREYITMATEIYRTGCSWRTLVEFALFQLRILSAKHLETGLVTKLDRFIDIVYYDGPTRYVARFPKQRGPCPFSSASVTQIVARGIYNSDPDITMTNSSSEIINRVREFAGPSHNFHGIPTTPRMLGYENLTLNYRDDTSRTFGADEVIVCVG